MQKAGGWTYMLASGRDGVLYTGATPDLLRRVAMHRQGLASHFTRRHAVTQLVWYEPHPRLETAAMRADLIRHCRRQWKLALVARTNPDWLDLYDVIGLLPDIPLLVAAEVIRTQA